MVSCWFRLLMLYLPLLNICGSIIGKYKFLVCIANATQNKVNVKNSLKKIAFLYFFCQCLVYIIFSHSCNIFFSFSNVGTPSGVHLFDHLLWLIFQSSIYTLHYTISSSSCMLMVTFCGQLSCTSSTPVFLTCLSDLWALPTLFRADAGPSTLKNLDQNGWRLNRALFKFI